ncbi:MAG: PIN domain-containing protein [Dermatophilus congolensis]|nr:PIN domain-containing protein [Dermatophilus congolensis]
MSAEAFIDTNVFVYALDSTDPRKCDTADGIIRSALTTGDACTSFQVLQEFLNVALKGARVSLTVDEARRFCDAAITPLITVWPSPTLYHRALDVKARWQFGFYDSLIVASALQAGCTTLLTEDLQAGQRIEGLTITNPFA